MIDYKEFKTMILSRLKKALADETTEVIEESIPKINRTLDAVVIKEKNKDEGMTIGRIIDFDILYHEYMEGVDVETIIDKIQNSARKQAPEKIQFEKIFSFAYCKEHLTAQVIAKEENMKFLERVVHRKVLNLALIYRVMLIEEDNETASIVVTKQMLKDWGISEDMLYQIAWENAAKNAPYRIQNLYDLFLGLEENTEDDDHEENQSRRIPPMYVISQGKGYFGASALAYPEAMRQAFAVFGEDFFLLPSSQQELIAVPFDKTEIENLKAIVCEINHTSVSKEEWLSDSVYYYDHEADEVRPAA